MSIDDQQQPDPPQDDVKPPPVEEPSKVIPTPDGPIHVYRFPKAL